MVAVVVSNRYPRLLFSILFLLTIISLSISCDDSGGTTSPDGDVYEQENDASLIPCRFDSECPEGMVCGSNGCVPSGDNPCLNSGECALDEDCASGFYCNEVCVCASYDLPDIDSTDGDLDIDSADKPSDECEAGPQISAETVLDFGYVQFDTDAMQTLHIINLCPGKTTLNITAAEIVSTSSEFRILSPPTYPVALSSEEDILELQVVYHPVNIGIDEGELVISSNDPDGVFRVNLTTRYKGTVDIDVTPNPLDFHTVVVGATAEERTLSIENLMAGDDDNAILRINDIYLESGQSSTFELSGLTFPMYVGKGQAKEVTVKCHPVDALEFTDTIVFESNDSDEASYSVPVRCEGVRPLLSVETLEEGNRLDFLTQRIDVPTSITLHLRNDGGGTLTIEEPALTAESSDTFSLDTTAFGGNAVNLDAGQSVDLPVQYVSSTEGSHSGQIRIDNTGFGTEVFLVNLAGAAAPASISSDPNPIDFDSVVVAQQLTIPVTLTNDGEVAVSLSSISFLNGTSVLSFADTDVLEDVLLEPTETHQISITFAPDQRGTFNNMLHLVTDDVVTTEVDVPINAFGIAPVLEVTERDNANFEGEIDFGEVRLNHQGERILDIKNVGDASMMISGIELTDNTQEEEFSFENTGLVEIPAGQKVGLTLRYSPVLVPGQDAGLLTITSSDPITPQATVGLKGVATDQRLLLNPISPMEFADTYFGASDTRTLHLQNGGILGVLTVTAATLQSGDGVFSLDENALGLLPAILLPNQGNTFSLPITFLPPAADSALGELTPYAGSMILQSDSYTSESSQYDLAGNGKPCPEGCWDNDDDPSVCEYCGCYLSNDGVEICDDIDNDCDSQTDEGDTVTSNCNPPENAAAICVNGLCDFNCNRNFHRCDDECVFDQDPDHCGGMCTACYEPDNATADCELIEGSLTCTYECNDGFVENELGVCVLVGSPDCCGEDCIDCGDNPTNGSWACEGGGCMLYCQTGFHVCFLDECVANNDVDHCGTRCTACQEPSNPLTGTATCDGSNCGLNCYPGYYETSGDCALCDSVQHCGQSCSPCPSAPPNGGYNCTEESVGSGYFCDLECSTGYYENIGLCYRCDTTTNCGNACEACPAAPAHGSMNCVEDSGSFVCEAGCSSGYILSGDVCVPANTNECCGAGCDDCTEGIEPADHIHGFCEEVATDIYQCAYECNEDYWDLDDDPSVCEYPCVFQSEEDAYGDGLDTNCDGVDGLYDRIIYVAQGYNGSGSRTDPKGTITSALNLATAGSMIWVSEGSYTGKISLKSGVHIIGGFRMTSDWAQGGFDVTVQANTIEGADNRQIGIQAQNISSSTIVQNLNVTVANNTATAGSNYGIWMKNCSSALEFRNVFVQTGTAGNGANGTAGSNGAGRSGSSWTSSEAINGKRGEEGCENSGGALCDTCDPPVVGAGGTSPCNAHGGAGGASGSGEDSAGSNGASGKSPYGNNVTQGGSGGAAFDCPTIGTDECEGCDECEETNGGDGYNGANGASGSAGSAGSGVGTRNGDYWAPTWSAGSGSPGLGGNGGGGAGGGSGGCYSCDSRGSAGSGGGGGGCGGAGGSGAQSGGASFGLFAIDSDPVFVGGSIIAGSGGSGGQGGAGGQGGQGGLGAPDPPYGGTGEQDDGGCGGSGGDGGDGGTGGSGGGGGGGPSFAVYTYDGSSPSFDETILDYLGGGSGGSGGNTGASGPEGLYGP